MVLENHLLSVCELLSKHWLVWVKAICYKDKERAMAAKVEAGRGAGGGYSRLSCCIPLEAKLMHEDPPGGLFSVEPTNWPVVFILSWLCDLTLQALVHSHKLSLVSCPDAAGSFSCLGLNWFYTCRGMSVGGQPYLIDIQQHDVGSCLLNVCSQAHHAPEWPKLLVVQD